MPQNRKSIHRHLRFISPIDALMPNQPGGRDHVRRHPISNEENDVLGPLHLGKGPHQPLRHGLGPIVISERRHIVAGLVEGNTPVYFGCNIDDRWLLGVLGEQILIPGEIPALDFGCSDLEIFGSINRFPPILGDGEGKSIIRDTAIGFGAIHGGMDFETDIEVLPREKVGPVAPSDSRRVYDTASRRSLLIRRKDAAQRRTRSQPLKRLRHSDAGERGCGTGNPDELGLHITTNE